MQWTDGKKDDEGKYIPTYCKKLQIVLIGMLQN